MSKTNHISVDSSVPMHSVCLDDLISLQTFCNEVGMENAEFVKLRKYLQVDGLIYVAGRFLVNRKLINIHYHSNGIRFRRWLELGGRLGPVDVKRGIAYKEVVSVKDLSGDEPAK